MAVNELKGSHGLNIVRTVEGDFEDVENCGEVWF